HVTDLGVAELKEARRELRACREPLAVRNRRRTARGGERRTQRERLPAHQVRVRSAARASVAMSGWVLHNAVICSPVPATVSTRRKRGHERPAARGAHRMPGLGPAAAKPNRRRTPWG